jgi:hypothetical protein
MISLGSTWAQVEINFPVGSHYCLTDLTVDSNDITVLVSGEQKHYFHLWGSHCAAHLKFYICYGTPCSAIISCITNTFIDIGPINAFVTTKRFHSRILTFIHQS